MKKISGSTGIRAQGLRNTIPALYHWATEPHVCLPHDISPNTCTRLHIPPPNSEFSPEFWRQRKIVKCSRGPEAEANHNVVCPSLGAKCNRWWKKYPAWPGFEPRASGIPSLCSTTELPSHMSVCLTIYHQIPVPGYITYRGTSDSDDSDSDSDDCVGWFPL